MASIKSKQEEQPLPDVELIQCLWQALISSIEWSARQDQNEALALREISVRHSYISSLSVFLSTFAPILIESYTYIWVGLELLCYPRTILQRRQDGSGPH